MIANLAQLSLLVLTPPKHTSGEGRLENYAF